MKLPTRPVATKTARRAALALLAFTILGVWAHPLTSQSKRTSTRTQVEDQRELGRRAEHHVQEARRAGTEPVLVARTLRRDYRRTNDQVAQLMVSAGYPASVTAAALDRGLGVDARSIYATLSAGAGLTSQAARVALVAAAEAPEEIVQISATLEWSPEEFIDALLENDSSTELMIEMVMMLQAMMGLQLEETAGHLFRIEAPSDKVYAALKLGFGSGWSVVAEAMYAAGWHAEELATVVLDTDADAAALTGFFLDRGISTGAVVALLHEAGVTLEEMGPAVAEALRRTSGTAQNALEVAGLLEFVGARAVAGYLESLDDAEVWEGLGRLVAVAGLSAQVTAGLMGSEACGGETLARVLLASGSTLEDAAGAMAACGATALAAARSLVEAFDATPQDLVAALSSVYALQQVLDALVVLGIG